MSDNLSGYPTLFRGVFWDAHWEFDAPCVMYYPFKRYGFGGNASRFDSMVEDVCIDLSLGKHVRRGFTESELKEFRWRGWSPRGFSRRKDAWHIQVSVEWFVDGYGEVSFQGAIRKEQWGPFATRIDNPADGDA